MKLVFCANFWPIVMLVACGVRCAQGSEQMMVEQRKTQHRPSLLNNNHHGIKQTGGDITLHPPMKASKDGLWTDPLTRLDYAVDLSNHFEEDFNNEGKNVLIGVGIYTKFIFKIRVYGVALYVSANDVAADPKFREMAGMSAKELKQNEEFFKHLLNMTDGDDRPIEKSLVLQLNMELSADTMRSSLDADWKLLDQRLKDMVTNSSLRPREANENMLERIADKKLNPNRCSCGQTAPNEFRANKSCCSRGTTLSFTWLNDGYCEARLDGRLMDLFEEPGLAPGIFYEYLRDDDPMSPDARDKFAEGFSHLLAPLEQ